MTSDLLGVPLGDAFAAEGKGTSCEKWRGCSSGELGLKGGQSGDKASKAVPNATKGAKRHLTAARDSKWRQFLGKGAKAQ